MTGKLFIVILFSLLSFWESYAQKAESSSDNFIKIGLLVTDAESEAAQNAASLAISEANKEEGLKDYQLVVRSMEGPWGTGSKQAVNLVFNENVWAILGSHDGRNAHLVEQVIAKTHVVFLSAWASDPTLYQAFVPWFYSIVPNDLQQADILVKEIGNNKNCKRIIRITENTYDAKMASDIFLKKLNNTIQEKSLEFFYSQKSDDLKELLVKIKQNLPACIVLFGQSLTPLVSLRKSNIDQPVFSTLSSLAEDRPDHPDLIKHHKFTTLTTGNWFDIDHSAFAKRYKEKYGKYPGAVAAYTYDGIKVVIKAIKSAGFDREKIQEAMKNLQYKGVTGSIRFDDLGKRIDAVELIKSEN